LTHLTLFIEEEKEEAKVLQKYEVGEQVDCLDEVKTWLNAEIIMVFLGFINFYRQKMIKLKFILLDGIENMMNGLIKILNVFKNNGEKENNLGLIIGSMYKTRIKSG